MALRMALAAGFLGFICTATATESQQQLFVKQLIAEEPKIKDATWLTPKSLYVGVIDDGTDRSGYASYICIDAKPIGATLVKVIDIVKLKRTGKFVELGRSHCK